MVDKGQKLSKWGPSGRVSQRLSMKERGAKVLRQKKKKNKKSVNEKDETKKGHPRGLYSRESQAQIMLQAMAHVEKDTEGLSFVPTGPGKGSGSGVYFVDFSDDYKKCLKKAREKLEKDEKLSQIEKQEMDWINELKESRSKPLFDKLIQLKVIVQVIFFSSQGILNVPNPFPQTLS